MGCGTRRFERGSGPRAAACTFALLLALALWLSPPAPAAFPGEGNGKLVFVRDFDIYTANPDGSELVNVRDFNSTGSLSPSWDANGARIVFCAGGGIYTMNSDGSDVEPVISANCEFYDAPSWSPDGTKILFADDSWSPVAQQDVFVVNLDGSGLTNLTNDAGYDSTPVWSPDGSRIAFASGPQSFDQDIYTMNPDGTGRAVVTDGIGSSEEPNWSPDGARLVFTSTRDCIACDTANIYSIDSDGTDIARLTSSPTFDRSPTYSPDGTLIAFESCDPLDCTQTIHVMSAAGTNSMPVVEGTNPDWGVPSPPFAPPGADGRIAYSSYQDFPIAINNRDEIYSMYANGYRKTRLTKNHRADTDPAWAADGDTLAFTGRTDGGDFEIYRMPADGSLPPVNLTNHPAQDVQPTWSPITDQIAFSSDRGAGSTAGIYVMDSDGTNPTELTDPSDEDAHRMPAWSPDGAKIAFVSFEDGDDDIYLMNPDGTGIENISNTSGIEERFPAWSPGGQQLAYIRDGGEGQNVWTMSRTGSGQSQLTTIGNVTSPTWSPSGTKVAFGAGGEIYAINVDGSGLTNITQTPEWAEFHPAWEPPHTSPTSSFYARPKSATPVTVRLVPAYKACTEPNAEHGAPLASPACSPPVLASDHLTVGAPPAQQPNSIGTVILRVFCTDGAAPPCSPSGDQIDIQMTASISDVRNQVDGSDYTGELRASFATRITDRWNTPVLGVSPATAVDTPFGFPLACTPTAAGGVGSTCSASTTADAVLPGIAREAQRAIWQLGAVQVYDGGGDGDAETVGDNTLFAVQGVFTP